MRGTAKAAGKEGPFSRVSLKNWSFKVVDNGRGTNRPRGFIRSSSSSTPYSFYFSSPPFVEGVRSSFQWNAIQHHENELCTILRFFFFPCIFERFLQIIRYEIIRIIEISISYFYYIIIDSILDKIHNAFYLKLNFESWNRVTLWS